MSKPKTRKAPKQPTWRMAALLTMYAHRPNGRMLGIIVDPETRAVLAVEGPAPVTGQDGATSLAAFFGDHAHAAVTDGTGHTLASALELAEKYAESWLTSGAPAADPCECGEVHP